MTRQGICGDVCEPMLEGQPTIVCDLAHGHASDWHKSLAGTSWRHTPPAPVDAEVLALRLATAEAERDAMRPVVEAVGDLLDAGHALDEADAEDDDWKGAEQNRDRAWGAMVDAHNAALNLLAAASPSSATEAGERGEAQGQGGAGAQRGAEAAPEAAYLAAARAQILRRVPDSTMTDGELADFARTYIIDDNLRAAVDAVWGLGWAKGRADAIAELDREIGAVVP